MLYILSTRFTLRPVSGFLALALLTFGNSCGSAQQQGQVKHFPLTVALSEPLGDAGAPLPEDIRAMFMPLEAAKNCPGILFVPDVKIVRLDIQGAKPEELDLGQDQNAIQKAAGQSPKPEKARSVREDALKKQQITSLMAQPAGPNAVTIETIKKLLVANQQLFSTEETQKALAGLLSANNVTIAHSPNELITKLTSTFCTKPGTKPQPTACTIIYKPGTLVSSETASTGITTSPTPEGDTNKPVSSPPIEPPQRPQSREDANKLYEQLSAEVRQAITGQANKKAVNAKLAKAQAEMTWDFRFTYERAKLAVYGTSKHDEAFYHLYRAAEIAIENGDADAALQRIQGDSGEDGPFHRLSHGHQEWKTLVQGLQTKNAVMVRK
jgi:hypothetical protein